MTEAVPRESITLWDAVSRTSYQTVRMVVGTTIFLPSRDCVLLSLIGMGFDMVGITLAISRRGFSMASALGVLASCLVIFVALGYEVVMNLID